MHMECVQINFLPNAHTAMSVCRIQVRASDRFKNWHSTESGTDRAMAMCGTVPFRKTLAYNWRFFNYEQV